MISRIGSPAAFYATELYMGLSQSDLQEKFKNSYERTTPFYQKPGNPFFEDDGSNRYPFATLSEKQQILHLKNKLLNDLGDPVSFDPHKNREVSQNSYAPQLVRPPGCLSTNNSAAVSSPIKTRIRWTQDLHDRFVDCVDQLGGPSSTSKAICRYNLNQWKVLHLHRNFKLLLINVQVRIEEQGKQLKMMFDQQQETTRNLMETRKKSSKSCPNSLSTGLEDSEVLVFDGCEDDIVFQSKIS